VHLACTLTIGAPLTPPPALVETAVGLLSPEGLPAATSYRSGRACSLCCMLCSLSLDIYLPLGAHPAAACPPRTAAAAAMPVWCGACQAEMDVEVDEAHGFSCCVSCGRVVEDAAFASDVQFQRGPDGEGGMVGQMVGEGGQPRGAARFSGGRLWSGQVGAGAQVCLAAALPGCLGRSEAVRRAYGRAVDPAALLWVAVWWPCCLRASARACA